MVINTEILLENGHSANRRGDKKVIDKEAERMLRLHAAILKAGATSSWLFHLDEIDTEIVLTG